MVDTVAEVAPEQDIARDMARRSLFLGPVLVLVSGIFWGWQGALCSAIALGLVVGNLLLGAVLITTAARISHQTLMVAALGGYLLRLAILTAAFFAMRPFSWFEVVPFAVTLLASHLVLVIWESRHVSMSLAYPGLEPEGS